MIEIILDANIPKKVKRLSKAQRVLHVGDIDTEMDDSEILHLMSKFNSLLVTRDRELAYNASKKHRSLFIRDPLTADEIVMCIEKNKNLLKTASIFCENGRLCKNC
ncbi:MAG TPA: hypothetical protein ENH13_00305 [Euryarchaeota archaeon]|nr:hypothetical protein BMS3Abin16_00778 [archaeon BMS3Abin16]GBE56973.1 hypothetical protein BMS3Bbin16_01188 [archaeon BMS3Bbin16]HDH27552.1 hypothetical protein [Euryarchaeota archaeon]HDY74161.1 hypothetical protein [Euryarchaeota archaeon]